jgi:large repetitive protein
MRRIISSMSNKSDVSGVDQRPVDKPQSKAVRFGSQMLAIEQRMLFDGALVVSVDATRPDKLNIVDKSFDRANILDGAAIATRTTSVPRDLVVVDTSITDWQTIASAVNPNSQLLLLNNEQDGLSQIANAMAGGNYKSVHIVSHGSDGKLKLGTRSVSSTNIDQYAADLARIGENLTDAGDIVLYGCDIGRGAAGATFLQALARATNADVAASTNDTGGSALGGDWTLEASTGVIEAGLPIDAVVAASYKDLLLTAQPSVTLGVATTATGDANKVLLGETFTMQATFDNLGPDSGFGPYIDVFYSAKGADGNDGLNFTGATYLGSPLTVTTITLTAGDISGGVTHPYFDNGTSRIVTVPPGYVAGDKLMVVQLPFGSFTAGQPAINIGLTGSLSNLADLTGGPALTVTARAGFRYGTDATNNPTTDPSLQQSTPLTTQAITPELYRVRTTYIGPENETASGINYKRAYRIDVDVAEGQTLTNLQLQEALPNSLQYAAISGDPGSITGFAYGTSPTGAWTNVNGVLVSGTGATGASAPAVPGGTVSRQIPSVVGTSGTVDASMVVQFYVPEFDSTAAPVLNAVSGDDKLVTPTVQVSAGGWTKLPGANDTSTAPVLIDTKAPQLTEQSISIQKSRVIQTNVGPLTVSPGDKLDYTLDIQVSDYFAFGGSAGQPLQIIDTISDGLAFDSALTPQVTINRADGTVNSFALNTLDYTVLPNAAGDLQIITIDLRAALARAGVSQVLVGDQFSADNTQNSAMTAKIVFRATVLDTYRVGPPDLAGDLSPGSTHSAINEGDRLINRVSVAGVVLDSTLNPNAAGLQTEADTSSVTDVVAINSINIKLTSIENNPVTGVAELTPGNKVTYRLQYTVPTGDYENFKMSAYLPQPVFSTIDPDANGGAPTTAFTSAGIATGTNPVPGLGRYSYRAIRVSDGVDVTNDPLNPILINSALTDGGANGISFDLGTRNSPTNEEIRIEIFFTVEASGLPFADGLLLTAASQSDNQNTALQPQSTQAIVGAKLTEPVLNIYKAAVETDVTGATVFARAYPAVDPSGAFEAAGNTAANPLTGSKLTSANIDALGNFANTLVNVDAGDTVRYAIVVENTGSSACGAYDIRIRDTLPPGISASDIVPGSLKVVRGDGVVLVSGTDYIGDINTLFGAAGIEFIDKLDPVHGGILGAARGLDSAGNVINGIAGANILVVTYDVKLPGANAATSVRSGSSYVSSAEIFNYTGVDGLNTATNPQFNHALTPLTDAASISTPLPTLTKTILSTSESFTVGSNVVIGEVVTYSVTLTVPEGVSRAATFTDTLGAGLVFVGIDSITSSAGLVVPNTALASASFDVAATTMTYNFGDVLNTATNSNAIAETITIVYRAVATDTAGNQAGVSVANTAHLAVQDAAANAIADVSTNVQIVEPTLTISKSTPTSVVQIGDTVEFTVVISNAVGGVRAHEVNFMDTLPTGLTFQSIVSAPAGVTESGGMISGLNLSGATPGYLDAGQSITIVYRATVNNTATLGQVFDSNAKVDWSSLPGTANNNLSGLVTVVDTERTGSGGVNDYLTLDGAPVTVLGTTVALTIVNTSDVATGPGSAALPIAANPGAAENVNVAPGEIVRYRMIVQLPEANALSARLDAILPPGIKFLNDNTATIGFVADGLAGGINSSVFSGADIVGGGVSPGSISGLKPTQLIGAGQISGGASTGDDVSFALGDLVNTDSDANAEFIVIEFNAMVDNAASQVVRNALLPASFNFVSGVGAGVSSQMSDIDTLKIVEPEIINVNKRLVGVVTNLGMSTATFETTFSNTGNSFADSVRVFDIVNSANLTFDALVSVKVNGTTIVVANTPGGIDFVINTLQPNDVVVVTYTAKIVDITQPVPPQNAEVTYTSLSATGKTLTTTGVGTSTTTGERTGDSAQYGGSMNTYSDLDGAGIGVISGRLWDDTPAYGTGLPSETFNIGERPLEGITVNLRDVASGLIIASTTTKPDGTYIFTGVAAANYKVEVATPMFNDTAVGGSGPVKIRYDAGGGTPVQQSDGVISLTIGEGDAQPNQDFGYVQINQAPVVTKPADKTILEDAVLSFDNGTGPNSAGFITVSDEVQNIASANQASLTVSHGTLDFKTGYTLPAGITVTGRGTANLQITGNINGANNINSVLAQLQYKPTAYYFGSDQLVVRIDDRGAFGDADGNCIPNEVVGDNLFDSKTINITITSVNNPPVAVDDVRTVQSNQTITNGQAITGNGVGDVKDTDPDLADAGLLTVCGVEAGNKTVVGTTGVGVSIPGTYGNLVLQASGSYTYTPNALGQALGLGATAVDQFSYCLKDPGGLTDVGVITINLSGLNNPPVARPDTNSTVEGATVPVTGNALTKPVGVNGDQTDTDPDAGSPALVIQGAVIGNVVTGPALTGGLGNLVGAHGTLTLSSNGTYSYQVNNADPAVIALSPTSPAPLTDVFTYTASDTQGGTANTTITITITGINNPPKALDDSRVVSSSQTVTNGHAINGNGFGDVKDTDPDAADANLLTICGVEAGNKTAVGTTGVGTAIGGTYGTLVLQASGSYTYTLNALGQALGQGASQIDQFSYCLKDPAGLTDVGVITINLTGLNTPPTAKPDTNATVEGATSPVTGNALVKPAGVNGDQTDTDPDTGSPALVIQGAAVGNVVTGPALTAGLGNLVGAHGTLTLNSNGTYSYQVNNADPAVIALSPTSPTPLTDVFTYTASDTQGGTSNTTITITITGINNPPVATDDTRSLQADQTIVNGQAINGNLVGDVKDTDPDSTDANLLTICGIEAGNKTVVGSTGVGQPIVGSYGTLVLQSNGSYTYTPNAAAQALGIGATAVDKFSYCLQDPAGGKDVGVITINLTGVNDPPKANPELFQLNKASPPTMGNTILAGLTGEQKDTDPDSGDTLVVQGVSIGTITSPLTGGVNTALMGSYGTLVLQPDGKYTYTLDPAKTAPISKTDNVQDVFSYTINDGHGGTSTTTITFKISGENRPPSGADKLIPLVEDTPYKITPADFGFTDPDVGDSFKAVRITELPNPAGGKLFFNGQEVVFTAANPFLTVPFADIGKLEFRPAPNVNTNTLGTPPSISFQVCDNDGALDPTPNKLTFTIAPQNDPPKASQSVYDMDAGAASCALDGLVLAAGTKPQVSDPDVPADTLTVTITSVPSAEQGQYFLGSSTVPLKAGDTLTPTQLQLLCFKPNPAIAGTPNANGRIPTTPLTFSVSDGKGGQDTNGTIQVNVRPAPVVLAPPLPPAIVAPPIVATPFVPPAFIPLPVGRTISTASALREADDIRFSPIEAAADLDAGGFFDSGRIKAVWNRERVAGVQVVAEEKAAPVKQEIDCAPAPKVKPKLKAVKRSVFAENLKDTRSKNFSEQLKTAQKRFKPPAKLMPKPDLRKDC